MSETKKSKKPDNRTDFEKDMDNLTILPLSIIPIQTVALQNAKMIKNVHLKSVIEVFSGKRTGSGQINVMDVALEFAMTREIQNHDMPILLELSKLPSYDIYSLRIALRSAGLKVDDTSTLRLSKHTEDKLKKYMTKFTRPLVAQVYGSDYNVTNQVNNPLELFQDSDIAKVREKLQRLAQKLEIEINQVPVFLENYGDTFLSLSYYQDCLNKLKDPMKSLLDTFQSLRNNWQLGKDPGLIKSCDYAEEKLKGLMKKVIIMFKTFDQQTDNALDDLTATKFVHIKRLIESHHKEAGTDLCALSAKLLTWKKLFPDGDSGSPAKRATFIRSDLIASLDTFNLK